MYSKIHTAILEGIQTRQIQVEVDISNGMPAFDMVGYLSAEVRDVTTNCLIQRSPRIYVFIGVNGHFTVLFHRGSMIAAEVLVQGCTSF